MGFSEATSLGNCLQCDEAPSPWWLWLIGWLVVIGFCVLTVLLVRDTMRDGLW